MDKLQKSWQNAAAMSSSFTLGTFAAFTLILLGFSTQAVQLAHRSVALADTYEVRTALEMYASEHGNAYPTRLADLVPQYLTVPQGAGLNMLAYSQAAGGATYSLDINAR